MTVADLKKEGLYEKFKNKERKGRFFFTWLVLLVSGGLQGYGIMLGITGYIAERANGRVTFFANITFPVVVFCVSVLGPVFLRRIGKDTSALIYALIGFVAWPFSPFFCEVLENMFQ